MLIHDLFSPHKKSPANLQDFFRAVYSNQLRHLEGSALWGIDCLLILLYMRNGFFIQRAVQPKLKH